MPLGMAARMLWPTPQVSNRTHDLNAESTDGRSKPNKLGWAVRESLWPTPRASDGNHPGQHGQGGMDLRTAVERFPTPTVAMHKGSSHNAMTRQTGASRLNDRLDYSVEQGRVASGRLNPMWVEWLMGFPIGWTDCGHSETRLCRKWSSGSGDALLPSMRR